MKTKLALLVALALSTSATAAFRCVDEKGRTHIGDTPPAGCANVVMQEVTRGGTVIRTIQPSMTEEQWKAKQEAEEKARIAEKAAAEQKRKDMALLATYANEKEFDTSRDRNIDPIKARIAQSNERVKEIDKRVKVVKEEMEFYDAGKKKSSKKDEMPSGLQMELERLADEKKTIQKTVATSEKEIAELRAKYEVDKKRWIALKSGAGSKLPEAPEAEAKAEPKPAAKSDAKPDAKPAPKKS
jgi:chromosome segregation ATPase